MGEGRYKVAFLYILSTKASTPLTSIGCLPRLGYGGGGIAVKKVWLRASVGGLISAKKEISKSYSIVLYLIKRTRQTPKRADQPFLALWWAMLDLCHGYDYGYVNRSICYC